MSEQQLDFFSDIGIGVGHPLSQNIAVHALVSAGTVRSRQHDAALYRQMMDPESLSHRVERRLLSVPEQHFRPRHSARRASVREREISVSFPITSSVIANSTACRHLAMMPVLV